MEKRKLQIRSSYEINRLAETHLSDAYEKLFPTMKQKIKIDTKENNKEENKLQLLTGAFK